MKITNIRAVSGINPLLSDQYTAWVEIQPTLNNEPIARILSQPSDGNIVLSGLYQGKEVFSSTHSNAEAVAYGLGAHLFSVAGFEWEQKHHKDLNETLERSMETLYRILQDTNQHIMIGDELNHDMDGFSFPRPDPQDDIRILIIDYRVHNPLMQIIVTTEEISVLCYGFSKEKIQAHDLKTLWKSRYRAYPSSHDNVLRQVILTLSIHNELNMEFGDIHKLAKRIFAAKKTFHPGLKTPREEYFTAI